MYSIYLRDCSPESQFDAKSRGYRGDVFVKIGNATYQISVYDTKRLLQDFAAEVEYYGFFTPEPNLVLVEEVSNDCIKSSIKWLIDQKYFEDLKPVSNEIVAGAKLCEI